MNFNRIGEKYDNLYSFESNYEPEIIEKIVDICGDNNSLKLLDLGGGTGKFSEKFKKLTNWEITIGDISNELLKQASYKNLKTIYQDLNNLNLVNDKYDIILIKCCIHFVNNLDNFYKNLSNCLNKNGKIFIITRPQLTELPFNDKLKKQWMKIQPHIDDLLKYSDLYFNKKIEHLKYRIKIKEIEWINMILNKSMSHINGDDVEELRRYSLESDRFIEFYDNLIFVQLKLK